MRIKNLVLSLLVTSLTTLNPAQLKAESSSKTKPNIAITQFIQHEAADLVREGILKALADRGFVDGDTAIIHYENAQGNATTAAQIARKISAMDIDLVLPITTPSAQTVLKSHQGKTTPIVFSAVTDPVSAGLVSELEHPRSHVTGVTDMPPIKEQVEFIKEILPEAKTIGVLYNPGDEGSVVSLKVIHDAAKEQGLTIIESPATRSVDVKAAVLYLVGKVDGVYVPLDNTFVSAMTTVSQVALKNGMPLFTADSGSVSDGAMACLGYSYYDQGLLVGKVAADILEGASPQDMSIRQPEGMTVYLNERVIQQLGIQVPKEIASRAELL